MHYPQGSYWHLVSVIKGLLKNDPDTTRAEASQTILDNGDWTFNPDDLDDALELVFGDGET